MSKEEMFAYLLANLKAKGFGAPAASRIAHHVVEISYEESNRYDQILVLEDTALIITGLIAHMRALPG